jgi:hypothetical protein
LVVLVADADMREGVSALLRRPLSLGVRKITFDVYRHNGRDAGCLRGAHVYLGSLAEDYDRALVVFDRHGCGSTAPANQLEEEVCSALERSGWAGRCAAVVIEPELEVWVWGRSRKVAECLGWANRTPTLRDWLEQQGLWPRDEPKPLDPKAAVETAQREVRRKLSPQLFRDLGASVGVRGCEDPSFTRFCAILRRWFPAK